MSRQCVASKELREAYDKDATLQMLFKARVRARRPTEREVARLRARISALRFQLAHSVRLIRLGKAIYIRRQQIKMHFEIQRAKQAVKEYRQSIIPPLQSPLKPIEPLKPIAQPSYEADQDRQSLPRQD